MTHQNTPEECVKRILKGDIESYSEIVDNFQNIIYSIGMRFFKNENDSNDFTQEVFIRAYNNLSAYKGFGKFKYWLIKLAYNYAKDKIKNNKPINQSIEYDIVDKIDGPLEQHINKEIRLLLLSEIDKLPEKYKICLDFYFFIGLTYKQIEDITKIPVNAVKSHVVRAKKILRSKLQGTIAEDYNEM